MVLFGQVIKELLGIITDWSGKEVLQMNRNTHTNRLWAPNLTPNRSSAYFTHTNHDELASLWHKRLGHLHPDVVIFFLKKTKLISLSRKNFHPCDSCALGKLKQTSSTRPFYRSPGLLNLVHSDLIGPISPPTKTGLKYILTFIDDHTRYSRVYLLKSKDRKSVV